MAIITGLVLHALIFHPWIPYSLRESRVPSAWAMAVILGFAGLVLTYGIVERRGLVVLCIVAGMFLGNIALIAYDWTIDPTTHNLFPFEFVMIAFAAVPASVGAWMAHLAGRSQM